MSWQDIELSSPEFLNTKLNIYKEQHNEYIKECIKKMNETDNVQFARDAANIYANTLKPLLEKIRHLKYNEYTVLHNDETISCNENHV